MRDAKQTAFAASALCYLAICIILLVDAWRLLDVVASGSPQAQGIGLDRSVAAASFIVLIYLGWLARRKSGVTAGCAFMLGIVSGVLFFTGSLGSGLVDPRRIDWLQRGDWATHYAGWALFRHAPWAWPPGILPTLMYPVGTAVIYTDSLPLLAYSSRWRRGFPEPFQYTGGWFVVSFVLQGIRRHAGATLDAQCRCGSLCLAALFLCASRFF